MPEFVRYPDPRLSAKALCRPVDEALRETGTRLLAAAEGVLAYGLAGAHIGDVEPVVVISTIDPKAGRNYLVMFNPEIVETGGPLLSGPEGSVSLPGVEAEMTRSQSVVVAFEDADGTMHRQALDGFAARVAQHEIEQVNGVFFLTHLSRLKRERLLRKAEKQGRGA